MTGWGQEDDRHGAPSGPGAHHLPRHGELDVDPGFAELDGRAPTGARGDQGEGGDENRERASGRRGPFLL